MPLPKEILDRVARVLEYHAKTIQPQPVIPPMALPSPYRVFDGLPKIPLPTSLLDVSTGTLEVLGRGLAAVPDSMAQPPQDLKTLASWLYFSYGLTVKQQVDDRQIMMRTCPSLGHTFPCEIYVAAFGVAGLEPGLYHFSPREFALRRMRNGPETLSTIKRGRPDLEFLKLLPAALLVSTIFCRASSVYGLLGYRAALCDAGALVQNLAVTATGLGIQNMVRLRMTNSTMHELIGVPVDADYAHSEAVQAMVVWGDRAAAPILLPPRDAASPIASGGLPPIARKLLAAQVIPYGSIQAVHQECVATGMAVREVRPPMTEIAAISDDFADHDFAPPEEDEAGAPLRTALLQYRVPKRLTARGLRRDWLVQVNQRAFRGGTYFPLFPAGPHVALVRPFWIMFDVSGMEAGVWYYHPHRDAWAILFADRYRKATQAALWNDQRMAGASAVCVLTSNLQVITEHGGPDLYRLANLEAGIAAQRLHLAAYASGLAAVSTLNYDDEAFRVLLGIDQSAWEILTIVAIGAPASDEFTSPIAHEEENADIWRG